MLFSIVGYDGPRLVAQTRTRPSSAALLAQLWQDRGYDRVRIECDGGSFDPAEFRDCLLLTANGMKTRVGKGKIAP